MWGAAVALGIELDNPGTTHPISNHFPCTAIYEAPQLNVPRCLWICMPHLSQQHDLRFLGFVLLVCVFWGED